MPPRLFPISIFYVEYGKHELNLFIANHRVAHIERKWIEQGSQSAWVFCVEYTLASLTRY